MSDPNLDDFGRLFPIAAFSDHDALISAQGTPSEPPGGGVVASMACRRITPPNTFALAFATRNGDRKGPFVLTPRVAAEIRKTLVELGF